MISFEELKVGKKYRLLRRAWTSNDWLNPIENIILGTFIGKIDKPDWNNGLCLFRNIDGIDKEHRHREIHMYEEVEVEIIKEEEIIKITI